MQKSKQKIRFCILCWTSFHELTHHTGNFSYPDTKRNKKYSRKQQNQADKLNENGIN